MHKRYYTFVISSIYKEKIAKHHGYMFIIKTKLNFYLEFRYYFYIQRR